jgi:hypothetical protein
MHRSLKGLGSLLFLSLCLAGCAAQDQDESASKDVSAKQASSQKDRSEPLKWKFQVGQLAMAATESLVQMLEDKLMALPGVGGIRTRIQSGEFTLIVEPASGASSDLAARVEAALVKGTGYPFVRVRD